MNSTGFVSRVPDTRPPGSRGCGARSFLTDRAKRLDFPHAKGAATAADRRRGQAGCGANQRELRISGLRALAIISGYGEGTRFSTLRQADKSTFCDGHQVLSGRGGS